MLNGLILAGVVVISAMLTNLVRRYALRRRLLDIPNDRSSHTVVTPRGGGAAIVIVFLTATAALFGDDQVGLNGFMALFGGGLMVAAVGFLDDHHHVPARWRLLTHFGAGSWALWWLGGLPPIPLGGMMLNLGWVGDLATLLLMVWLINLYNFMDGIDGIAGVETVTVAGGAAALLLAQGNDGGALLTALLAAASAGFLAWNWPPARVFMGDVGSGFLGYVFGVLMLMTASTGTLSPWSWIILLGVFVIDATVTLIRRMIRRERWFEAHCSHSYQRLARRWNNHTKVTMMVLGTNLVWLLPLAWYASSHPRLAWLATGAALLPLLAIALRITRAPEPTDSPP